MIKFLSIKKNETIRTIYTSAGCFHHFTKLYEIHGGEKIIFVVSNIINVIPSQIIKKSFHQPETKTIEIGSKQLSDRELAGLDALFQLYRNLPFGGCTTIIGLDVTYFRDSKIIGEEHFVDSTCMVEDVQSLLRDSEVRKKLQDSYDIKLLEQIVSFNSLEKKIKKKC